MQIQAKTARRAKNAKISAPVAPDTESAPIVAPTVTPAPAEKPTHAHVALKLHYAGASKQRNANRATAIKLRNSGGLTQRTYDLYDSLYAEYKNDGFIARGLDNKILAFLINGNLAKHVAGSGKAIPDSDNPAFNVLIDAPSNPVMLTIVPPAPVKQ